MRVNLWDTVLFAPEGEGTVAPGVAAPPGAPQGEATAAPDVANATAEDFDFNQADADPYESLVNLAPAGEGAADVAPSAPSVPASESPAATPSVGPQAQNVSPAASQAQPAAQTGTVGDPNANAPGSQQTAPQADVSGATVTLVQQLEASRTQIMTELQNGLFKLEQPDIDAIEGGEAANVIPKLMAKAHFEGLRAMTAIMEQRFPQLVSHAIEARSQQTEAEREIFSNASELIPYKSQVFAIGQQLRAMNPTMPKAEFLPRLTATARAMLGVQPQVASPTVNGRGQVQVSRTGFSPAVSAVPSSIQAPQIDPNSWEAQDALFELEAP